MKYRSEFKVSGLTRPLVLAAIAKMVAADNQYPLENPQFGTGLLKTVPIKMKGKLVGHQLEVINPKNLEIETQVEKFEPTWDWVKSLKGREIGWWSENGDKELIQEFPDGKSFYYVREGNRDTIPDWFAALADIRPMKVLEYHDARKRDATPWQKNLFPLFKDHPEWKQEALQWLGQVGIYGQSLNDVKEAWSVKRLNDAITAMEAIDPAMAKKFQSVLKG